MLKARKKIVRKEIKQDKLVTTYFETKDWVNKQENRKKLFITVGIIAFLVVAVIYYVNYKKRLNNEAEGKLFSAISLYEQGMYQKAMDGDDSLRIQGFREIINSYGSTENGNIAKFYLANCLYYLKDYDNALSNYEDYSGSNVYLKASSLAGIGAVYEAKGDPKKAAEYYEKSTKVNKDLVLNQENLFYALRCYSHSGDRENAKRLYLILKDVYPKSSYISEVKRFESEFLN